MSMTRQEQLDAVVRNYGKWEGDIVHFRFIMLEDNDCSYVDAEGPFSNNDGSVSYAFTRAEVEQRKAELQNKPRWGRPPAEANFIAQNSDGSWGWFAEKPTPEHDDGYWCADCADGFTFRSGEVIGDWRDTLEKRPVAGDQPTPEEEEAFNMLEARNGDSGSLTDEGSKWDGEGLPPVGVECYLQLAFNDMGECLITYMGDGVFCYRQNSSGNEYTGSIRDTVFRPIKSDCEKWVEHAKGLLGYDDEDEQFLRQLYNAGLAKMPES